MLKKLSSTRINNTSVHLSLLILRLVSGGFMLTHGIPKLLRILDGNFRFADPLGLGSGVSLTMAVFAEVICALMLILGLGTRLATIPLIITMAVAAFVSHGNDPFARKELALLYLVAYFILLLNGSGKFAFENFFRRRK